jgi:hypothetical protein
VLASDTDAAVQACTRANSEFPTAVKFARLLIAAQENRAFKQTMTSPEKSAAELHLNLYPQGGFASAVRARLAALNPAPRLAPGGARHPFRRCGRDALINVPRS